MKKAEGQKITKVEIPDDLSNVPCYKNHPVESLQESLKYMPQEWTVDYYYPSCNLFLDIRHSVDEDICKKKNEIMKEAKLNYRFQII